MDDQFLPSLDGLHFENNFPPAPLHVEIPILGKVHLATVANGLCGGMTATVLDLWYDQRRPPPDKIPPAADSPLFDYICQRQVDSFSPHNLIEFAWELLRPSPPDLLAIRKPIKLGTVVPLGLVFDRTAVNCHQVLAYAWDDDSEIRIYNCNWPDQDHCILKQCVDGSWILQPDDKMLTSFFMLSITPQRFPL